MAKVTVKVRFAIKQLVDTVFDGSTTKQLGNMYLNETKRLVSIGKSPVKGRGRFIRYAIQRDDAQSNYPEGLKDRRPVNLYLSGKMLSKLTYKRRGKNKLAIGLPRGTPRDILDRATTHNNGNPTMNIPKRQFIPDRQGERYVIAIEQKRKAILEKRLRAIIRKSNKKR